MPWQDLFISFRPKQWIKNLFLFAALIFAQKFLDNQAVVLSCLAFLAFCFVSSSVYLINDVVDAEKDKMHPFKKDRPIARGTLSKTVAIWVAVILLIISILVSFNLGVWFLIILLFYWLLNLFYSFYLKNLVILDVIAVALGFVLRVIAGAVAIQVVFSSWLLLCTFFLTLFLALGKRKNELLNISGNATRGVLADCCCCSFRTFSLCFVHF
ncbi:MAG: UbiA prenyltransferase family protein [Candidatus Magasanikbacteria bacterium]|nr:UbiA prenyltransferase family protein [Candidatus Magasanikbacteria bacterium]